MKLEGMLAVSASALDAEKTRMNVIASNMANVNSTRSLDGGPYRRKDVVFSSNEPDSFGSSLNEALGDGYGVKVEQIAEDSSQFKSVYNPGHPDADSNGYLLMPNVNIVDEMVNMMSATRAYEANVNALIMTKSMANKALEIGN